MQELFLYGVIEPGGEVSAAGVRAELESLNPGRPLLARINSPGGVVFEAVAIHTMLSQWRGGVDVQIDGLAASAASYLATVGRNVIIARDAMVMIHEPWGVTIGNATDHAEASATLDQIAEMLTGAYATRTGKTRSAIRDVMKAETWFTSAGAVEFGLADGILDPDGGVTLNRPLSVPQMQAMLNAFAAL